MPVKETIYEIKISGLGGGSEEVEKKEGRKKAEPSGLESISKALHPIKTAESYAAKSGDGATYYALKAFENVVNITTNAVQMDVNRYFQFSEDYKNQAYLGNIKNNISKAKNLGTSIISGATMGSMFGPIGAGFGATMGAITSSIDMIRSYDVLKANYESSLNATRISTAWQAQRAGLYNNGRGTEN